MAIGFFSRLGLVHHYSDRNSNTGVRRFAWKFFFKFYIHFNIWIFSYDCAIFIYRYVSWRRRRRRSRAIICSFRSFCIGKFLYFEGRSTDGLRSCNVLPRSRAAPGELCRRHGDLSNPPEYAELHPVATSYPVTAATRYLTASSPQEIDGQLEQWAALVKYDDDIAAATAAVTLIVSPERLRSMIAPICNQTSKAASSSIGSMRATPRATTRPAPPLPTEPMASPGYFVRRTCEAGG